MRYGDADFDIIKPGSFVTCAVTGAHIRLDELRYWSIDLQEAYASPEAVRVRNAGGPAQNDD